MVGHFQSKVPSLNEGGRMYEKTSICRVNNPLARLHRFKPFSMEV